MIITVRKLEKQQQDVARRISSLTVELEELQCARRVLERMEAMPCSCPSLTRFTDSPHDPDCVHYQPPPSPIEIAGSEKP